MKNYQIFRIIAYRVYSSRVWLGVYYSLLSSCDTQMAKQKRVFITANSHCLEIS